MKIIFGMNEFPESIWGLQAFKLFCNTLFNNMDTYILILKFPIRMGSRKFSNIEIVKCLYPN